MALTQISTAGVKDDAVTSDKVANAINSAIAANTAKTQTTINNNADNRVITGSGTANTLEGEANCTFNGSQLDVTGTVRGNAFIGRSNISAPTADVSLYRAADNTLALGTASTERMRVDSSGRLLLGTTTEGVSTGDTFTIATSSSTGMTLRSGTSNEGNIFFSDGTSGADEYRGSIQYNHGSNFLTIGTDGSERLRIDSSGNVGIGKTPSDRLDVQTTHASGGRIATFYNSDSGNNGGLIIQGGGSDGEARLQSAGGSSFLTFYTEGGDLAERMRIDSDGDLLIGTTSGISGGVAGAEFHAGNNSELRCGTTGTGNSTQIRFYNDNGEVGAIRTNGSATVYHTSSDYRRKENAVAISDGITRLKTLKPYRFNFKADSSTILDGFFAHEVTAVPEAVSGTKDEVDSDNNPIYQGIDQSKLVPLLTAALKEAIDKIETLETKVAALEAA
jgi:hypothetical protein